MRYATSHYRPIVDRHRGTVIGWRVRVTVAVGTATGFDDIDFHVLPNVTTPADWPRAAVDQLVAAAAPDNKTHDPATMPPERRAFAALVRLVEERDRVEVIEKFEFQE